MATGRKNVEVYVGLFVLIGFCFIAGMVVTFGKMGQKFSKFYEIRVEFPNAGGLVKDSDVLLSGTRIGYVAESPRLTGHSYAAEAKLNIRDDVKIPRKSTFLVGSSGLMGDRYVDVVPHANFDPTDIAQPGDLIEGTRASGLDDLTSKGAVVMDQLSAELLAIQKMTAALNDNLLGEKNLKNLEETFANLKATSANFSEGSKKLTPLLADAEKVVAAAKETMGTADKAAGDLRGAIAEFKKTAETATKTIDSAKGLIESGKGLVKKANDGGGPLGTLLSDRESAENLSVFLANLRRYGPIFYKNRPVPTPAPAAPRRR